MQLSVEQWPDSYRKHIDKLIAQIWAKKQSPTFDVSLLTNYAEKLTEAVIKGFGKDVSDADWNTPNYDMINALKTNVWQFSAAKTHTQLRDMGKALVKADGTVRDFKDFKIQAQQISGMQLNWLRTEYDTAIGGATMAGKWVQIQAQKHLFPYLAFDAVIDKHTSDLCGNLHGVIKPVDDAFWKKYYPPNHFNCRSTVRQVADGNITDDSKISYPEKMPSIFKVNLGENGLVFPIDHAYYTDVPAHIINNATLYMPVKEQYLIRYKSADGTVLKIHRKTELEAKGDLADLIKVSQLDADRGVTVDILPEIHASETALREKILPGAKAGKNPDRLLNLQEPLYDDVKRPELPLQWETLQTRIAKGANQADSLTFILGEDYPAEKLQALAIDRFRVKQSLKKLTFIVEDTGEVHEFINDQRR